MKITKEKIESRNTELLDILRNGHSVAEKRAARDELVEINQPLVFHVAKKYAGHGLGLKDLIQEANIGLLKAIKKFDAKKGSFGSYAYWWCKSFCIKAIQRNFPVHVPFHVQQKNRSEGIDQPLTCSIDDVDPIAYDGEDSEQIIARQEIKEFVRQMLACLPARNRAIVEMRFGIEGGQERTLEEIGQHFSLTKERIRQILENSFEKIAEIEKRHNIDLVV